jgi:mannosyltransferase OCH1-like enzyme
MKAKQEFKNKNFPKDIIFPLDQTIELPQVELGKDIPKKIYRCYSTKEKMKDFQKVFDFTKERMKDYEQIFFDDDEVEQFINKNFSERIYNAYKHINPDYGAARADFFRYLVIYLYGGVYMDIKTGPNQIINIDFEPKLHVSKGVSGIPGIPKFHLKETFDLNDDWSFVTGVDFGSEWQQFFIVSNKGNPFVKETIQQVVTNIEHGLKQKESYNSGNISVVAMTGPITWSLVIERNRQKYPDDIVFYRCGLGRLIDHSLIDYKKIMKDKHYSKIKNKNILVG